MGENERHAGKKSLLKEKVEMNGNQIAPKAPIEYQNRTQTVWFYKDTMIGNRKRKRKASDDWRKAVTYFP